MKKILATILISIALIISVFNSAEAKTVKVKSYYKPSTGAHVQSYYRSSPNRSKWDNYSTKGNYNPYTGKKGTVNPWNY